ncbi:Intradiol ring-cleavage dioxygenase [Dactylonectria macrodidyma]|uniref:Intradiol ring-cleavage dioxygenase n=1 Tax=Dactylonectria macrodidyma TaxID=307937 RepID=A0A9P9JGY0_9HYPO|nr:Intradiol ring-cleavage dioxygenase [Dactylonectria macrodidyma]
MRFIQLVAGALAAGTISAHPGHDHKQELAERTEALLHSKKDLSHCAEKLRARGVEKRSVERRAAKATNLLKRGHLKDRDLTDLLDVSHHSSADYDLDTPESTIFATNGSCVLAPESVVGPYYVSGEYVRQDIVETQAGVDLALDLQVLDVATCEPITGAYLEIWHCNSTGVYSGVSSGGNYESAPENLDSTFLRGAQQTDSDGAVQFDTLFPGHYQGRTTHIHVILHLNATPLANGTIRSTTATHVGQIFFDQDLIYQVEEYSPYTTNTQDLTTNAQDGILEGIAETSDPFTDYVLLGNSVSDGLLGWLSFGVNTSLISTVSAAATYYADGGVENGNSGGGGGGGGGGGTPPGAPPSV